MKLFNGVLRLVCGCKMLKTVGFGRDEVLSGFCEPDGRVIALLLLHADDSTSRGSLLSV